MTSGRGVDRQTQVGHGPGLSGPSPRPVMTPRRAALGLRARRVGYLRAAGTATPRSGTVRDRGQRRPRRDPGGVRAIGARRDPGWRTCCAVRGATTAPPAVAAPDGAHHRAARSVSCAPDQPRRERRDQPRHLPCTQPRRNCADRGATTAPPTATACAGSQHWITGERQWRQLEGGLRTRATHKDHRERRSATVGGTVPGTAGRANRGSCGNATGASDGSGCPRNTRADACRAGRAGRRDGYWPEAKDWPANASCRRAARPWYLPQTTPLPAARCPESWPADEAIATASSSALPRGRRGTAVATRPKGSRIPAP